MEFVVKKIGKIIITLSECNKLEETTQQLKSIRQMYDIQVNKCEEENYGDFVNEYFNQRELTHEDLYIGLQKFYKHKKEEDINYTLSIYEFIEKFPQKTSVSDTNYKKQHVFEALCRLLLLLNYDDIYPHKHFYDSLDNFCKGSHKKLTGKDILSMKINVGNNAGIVDIFFKSTPTKTTTPPDKWACEGLATETKHDGTPEYIMIQNKYYSIEKSNIEKYDVTNIYTLSDLTNKNSDKFKDGKISIVLMINNEDALSDKLLQSKRKYPDLIQDIYGVSSINTWFQKMLFVMLNTEGIPESNTKMNNIQLRFHQKFVVDCTQAYIQQGITKFIWGAVPRSGKSYMIGGLIESRKEIGNDIVIILGAKTETQSQFAFMFTFANFDEYDVIIPGIKQSYSKDKKIYLLSQEWFKKDKLQMSEENPKDTQFNEKIKYEFNKPIDLYFDEIHKGGSTDKSEHIIHAFKNKLNIHEMDIGIFVMVTATFAKPSLRYTNLTIGRNEETKIIEWSYLDQQNMKTITNETKKEMIIQTRSDIQQYVLQNVFDYYHRYYGLDYLTTLSNEYKKYPELVIITPDSIPGFPPSPFINETTDVRNIFIENLTCNACIPGKEVEFYREPSNIFKDQGLVQHLLNYVAQTINPNCIYNFLKNGLNYPVDQPHTEIWFLPDKDLYTKEEECKTICKPIVVEENLDEDNKKSKSIANIEPLTRGLAIKMCNHQGFDDYNIFINHNTFQHLGKSVKDKIFIPYKHRICLYDNDNKKSVSDQLKEYEKETYKKGRKLIILTGAKLRLGISLPCADIAFNFDNISSIDSNYQTMFRVLTERETPVLKTHGYYIDLNVGRAIQFLYEYNKEYGDVKQKTLKESVTSLQSLLFTFNYNGLNLIKYSKDNLHEHLELYNKLIKKLELTDQDYINFYSKNKNMIEFIKQRLAFINKDMLKSIHSIIQTSSKKMKTKKIKEGLRKGEKRIPKADQIEDEEENEEKKEEKEETDENTIIENLSNELPNIITLLALFSDEIQCSDFKECLKKSIESIKQLSFEEKCFCDNIDTSNILDCSFINYSNENLQQLLNYIIEIINVDEILGRRLFFIFDNIKTMLTKNKKDDCIICDMSVADINEKIIEHLNIREEEKNKFGEVFTPVKLIDEILDNLPKEVWTNPKLTWFDPANGIGNFPMIIYKRLMDSLSSWEPNVKKRSNHILTNMLFMNELNPKNVKISKKLFGSNANITCSNFLTNEFPQYDIIIGNPPFQKNKEETKNVGGQGKRLWEDFVVKCLNLLKSNGVLGFITPPNWREPENIIYELMTKQNYLQYLHIYSKKDGQNNFNVSQRFDLYVIQKDKKGITYILDENAKIKDPPLKLDVTQWPFIPNYEFKTIHDILAPYDEKNVIYKTIYHSTIDKHPHMSKNKTGKFIYPVVHNINDNGWSINLYSNEDKGHFGVPKVILNKNEKQYNYPEQNDYEGKYGMSELTFGIPITSKKEGDDILKAVGTEKFKELIKATKWGVFQTNYKMFRYFKKDFYKYFLPNPTKMQALVRGHLTRRPKKGGKKTKKNNKL
jgi:hypothetical protein